MIQDPFRRDAPRPTDDELAAQVTAAPVSSSLGWQLEFEAAQVTDAALGFLGSDAARRFDAHRGRVLGDQYGNILSADEANRIYHVEGEPAFERPVNAHRAAEIHRQAQLRQYRAQTSARSDMSGLERLGASMTGAITDPVMLPTWFVGGGSAALRAMRVAPALTRAGSVARGATVGLIDGVTGGVVAEGLNASIRRGAGEDYRFNDAARNVLFGAPFGAAVGGTVGGATHRAPRAGAAGIVSLDRDQLRTAMRAQETGSNPRQISRDPDGAGPAGGGAVGALQLLPETAERMAQRLGIPFDPRRLLNDVDYNVRLSDEYMRVLTDRYGGDSFLAVTAYHAGEGNVDGWIRRHGDPRTGRISRSAWLARIEAKNPRSAHYPKAVLQRMGLDVDGLPSGAGGFGVAPTPQPRVLRALTDDARVGGFVEAVEAIADDRPVDLGALLMRGGLEALDEASAVPTIRGQWLEADVAVTRGGAEIPVRFALVELDDLKTSHGDDLIPDAAYPAALQPRDRTRAGSQAANYGLERDLNPALLMRDKAAAGGAPIVSPDGVVESGNGRTIALRRSARTGTEAWKRYTAELARQGFDASGFEKPVLVRMRSEPMTGERRADMAADLNRSPTEAYSPVEQARGDARRLDPATLGLIEGDDAFEAGNRPFVRAFVQRVAPGDANALTDARGALSLSGRQRVEAALVQAAYGDDGLTAALFEQADPTIKAIGRALADAAPGWARMRATAPKAMDLTANLRSAVELVRQARGARQSVGDWMAVRLGQGDMFGGEAISPETEALVRLMFRDRDLTKPRGAARLADALRDYARGAAETPAGPDLFGDAPDGRAFLETLRQRYDAAEGDGVSGLAHAGGSEPGWTTREAAPPVLDLRQPEPDGGGPGRGGERPGDGDGAGGSGEPDREAAERLSAALAAAEDPDAPRAAADFAPVSPDLSRAAAEAGLSLEGFSHSISPDDVRHIRKRHGGEGEAARGQTPVTSADLQRLPDVVSAPDFVRFGLTAQRQGQAQMRLALAKTLPDGTVVVIEEVRRAKGRLAVVSMWKAPAGTDARGLLQNLRPNVRDGAGESNIVDLRRSAKPGPSTARAAAQARAEAFIAADPELKALMEDTEALAQAAGIEVPGFDLSTEPSTLFEGIRAAAFCLATENDVSRVAG